MTTRVLLAVTNRELEAAVIDAMRGSGGRAELTRRCVDLADVLAAAATGLGDIVVVGAATRRLDRDAVDRLLRCGVDVVVVRDRPSDSVDDVWTPWGARAVVDPDPQAVVNAVLAVPTQQLAIDPVPSRPALGRLVAVWGPTGAPGRTTVAVNVADELARLGHHTVLADADTYGASVAQVLGLLDDTSGLAAVTRLAATGRLDPGVCGRASVALPSGLQVLTGVARPDRWVELRAASLQAVWAATVTQHAFVVVDCGFGLGGGPASSWPVDVGPPDRDEATLATLAMADTVLAVGSADPVGLVRLMRDLSTVAELAPAAQVQVVVTKCRRSAVGRDPAASLNTVLTPRLVELAKRFGARVSSDVQLVPDDRAALDAALLSGRTLAETATGSAAQQALLGMAERLGPSSAVVRRRRRTLRRAG